MDSTAVSTRLSGGFGVIGAVDGYLLGRRAKADEIEIKRGYDPPEQVSALFQEVRELHEIQRRLYQGNHGRVGDPAKVADYSHRHGRLASQVLNRFAS